VQRGALLGGQRRKQLVLHQAALLKLVKEADDVARVQAQRRADAFIIVTPEYNHSVPGGLKNAIDSVWLSFGFRNKPVAFVSYSGGIAGGVRAIEHLAHVFIEAEAAPMRNNVVIPAVHNAFDDEGQPVNPITNAAAGIMHDDIAWWSAALEKARAAGELPPGNLRLRAALAAN
jgi:NAD(P)H-dependent FMN reductase